MLGPNCLGVYDAAAALDLGMNEFTPGTLGVISQSGNLALELSLLGAQYGIGISRFASLGNQADIEAAELVEAFAADEHTRVIGVYCEDFRDGRAFARAGEAAQSGGQAGRPPRGRRQRGGRARGGVAHGRARERLGRRRGCVPGRRDPPRDDAEAADRLRARVPRAAPAARPPGRDRRRRRWHAASSPPTSSPRPASSCRRSRPSSLPPDGDRADDRHRQPRRPRGRRRAGLLELRAREHRRARVGRGRRRHLHRVLRRLQPA